MLKKKDLKILFKMFQFPESKNLNMLFFENLAISPYISASFCLLAYPKYQNEGHYFICLNSNKKDRSRNVVLKIMDFF